MSPSWTTWVASAYPSQLAVDDAGDLQDFDKAVVGAVDVADGDDALDVVPFARAGGRQGMRRERNKRDDDDRSGDPDSSMQT